MRQFVLTLALVATLGGCASSPPSQFYTLSATDGPAATSVGATPYAVLVGPVTVPESVDRPQLVLRLGENRVSIVEQARWAEPLTSAIPARIASELARQLGSERVMAYPQNPEGFDCQVVIDVLRFDSVLGDAATLEIAWTLRRSGGGAPAFGRALARERVEGAGYEALVAAHSRALRAVSAAIAEAIRRQEDPRVVRS
jgi:uncharacterized lipoprotein YmbA